MLAGFQRPERRFPSFPELVAAINQVSAGGSIDLGRVGLCDMRGWWAPTPNSTPPTKHILPPHTTMPKKNTIGRGRRARRPRPAPVPGLGPAGAAGGWGGHVPAAAVRGVGAVVVVMVVVVVWW